MKPKDIDNNKTTITQEADSSETSALLSPDHAALRVPIKGIGDNEKLPVHTPGWHSDGTGRWYQNPDGSFYAGGIQRISEEYYSFDENGYIQTRWITKGIEDLYFNEDGTYNPKKKRKMLALTFDDGPGPYTMQLLHCLEENQAHATFFMLGQLVPGYPEEVKKMVEIGCEIGNHTYDHADITAIGIDEVIRQFGDTDYALQAVCGQISTVARCPYGSGNEEIYQAVNKPFVMSSLDTLDWQLRDVEADYNAVMYGDLTDGSIILMHDIHEASVKAALRLIPDLIDSGYKLVTFSELAKARQVKLQNALYTDFWPSSLAAGAVDGYQGNSI